jgi:hypothetical protein
MAILDTAVAHVADGLTLLLNAKIPFRRGVTAGMGFLFHMLGRHRTQPERTTTNRLSSVPLLQEHDTTALPHIASIEKAPIGQWGLSLNVGDIRFSQ